MKDYIVDFFCGSIAGIVGVLAGHPLDTVKCRMQILSQEYRGLVTSCAKIIKEERFAALYKGIIPPLISQFPLNAL
jgi:solute carrier family 25 carnitine/acylcarnitine transporter 20/29